MQNDGGYALQFHLLTVGQQGGLTGVDEAFADQKVPVAVDEKDGRARIAQCPQALDHLMGHPAEGVRRIQQVVSDPGVEQVAQNVKILGPFGGMLQVTIKPLIELRGVVTQMHVSDQQRTHKTPDGYSASFR